MRDSKIIQMIIEEDSFESQMKLAEVVGYERLSNMVKEMEAAGIRLPHVIADIIGTLRAREDQKLVNLLEGASKEQVAILVQAYGSQKCLQAAKSMKNRSKAHLVVDYATPKACQEAEAFVANIEETGTVDYELAQKMVLINGVEETEDAIKTTGYSRPVKHIVADVMGPLKANDSEDTL